MSHTFTKLSNRNKFNHFRRFYGMKTGKEIESYRNSFKGRKECNKSFDFKERKANERMQQIL